MIDKAVWIPVALSPPSKKGNYVIETISEMGTIRRLEAYFNGTNFNITNQKLLRWLRE